MTAELFDTDDVGSLVRTIAAEQGTIDLKDFDIETFSIDSDYTVKSFQIDPNNYASDIRDAVGPIALIAEQRGYAPSIFTALYEATLNAFQHGNKRDPKKNITIAYKIEEDQLDIIIVDEGGNLDSNFIPFVQRHREGAHKERFLDFYDFAGKDRPEENQGTGTSFMHTYVDKVRYFKSSEGGLVVQLTKQKEHTNLA